MSESSSFYRLDNFILPVYTTFCLWIIITIEIGYFHILVIMNNAAVNIGIQISVQDTYLNYIFNVLMFHHTVFHKGSLSLHSHQQYTQDLIFPYSCQWLIFSVLFYFWIIATLIDVKYYSVSGLNCISLKIGDFENIFWGDMMSNICQIKRKFANVPPCPYKNHMTL